MVGPAIAIQFFLICSFFLVIAFLLFYTIKRRRELKKAIPAGLLFLILSSIAVYGKYNYDKEEYENSKKFLGDYKLEKLDGREWYNCKVTLFDGYIYNILKNDKIVGHGKWHIETAMDIPGPFLKIENGPTWVVWEQDRLIEFIDRRPD